MWKINLRIGNKGKTAYMYSFSDWYIVLQSPIKALRTYV